MLWSQVGRSRCTRSPLLLSKLADSRPEILLRKFLDSCITSFVRASGRTSPFGGQARRFGIGAEETAAAEIADGPLPSRAPQHGLPLRATRHHREAQAALHPGCLLDRLRHLRCPRRRALARELGAVRHWPDWPECRHPYATRAGIEAVETRVKALSVLRRRDLAKRPGVSVHDLGVEQCGIITFLNGSKRRAKRATGWPP
jgi:hypothetical protein